MRELRSLHLSLSDMEQTFFIAHRLRQVDDTTRKSSKNISITIEKYINLNTFVNSYYIICKEAVKVMLEKNIK